MNTGKPLLLFDSKEILNQILTEISISQISICIDVYIWSNDHTGNIFFEALCAAAKRGVKVRLNMDGFGSRDWILHKLTTLNPHENFNIMVFKRLPGWLKILVNFSKFNKRTHRKLYLFDIKTAYLGSFNITDDTLKQKELSLKIDNRDQVQILQQIFDHTWFSSRKLLKRFTKLDQFISENLLANSHGIFTTQTHGLRHQNQKMFLNKLSEAKSRIWLVTPYFNPPIFLLKALMRAAKSNIDVKIVLPSMTDLPFTSWMAHFHYRVLMSAGIQIYEYQPLFLHAKGSLIDDEIIVGTGNLNYRSFFRDLEINTLVTTPTEVAEFHLFFTECLRQSKHIKAVKPSTLMQRILTKFFMSFKEWL